MSQVLKTAMNEIGEKEIVGAEDNPTIVGYSKEIGLSWVNDDETPWCAIFVNWVLMKSGHKYSANASARSFENYSTETKSPIPGDIVVFWRGKKTGWKGHVGFFLGYAEDGNIYVLGGNQSNSVSIAKLRSDKLLSFRKVSKEIVEIPEFPMKEGDYNDNVTILQKLLKGHYTGIIDKDFGPLTKKAVISFQQEHGIPKTGIYDRDTCEKLFEILNQ